MEIAKRIWNGARAKEILDNEVFQSAWDEITEEITEQWKQSPARDPEGREKLWTMLKLCEKLRQSFQTKLETGKLAEMERTRLQKLYDSAKSALL